MTPPPASAPDAGTLRAALTSALMQVCDGTFGDDPATWSLEVGPGLPGGTVADLIDTLTESLRGSCAARPARRSPAPLVNPSPGGESKRVAKPPESCLKDSLAPGRFHCGGTTM